MTRVLLVDDQLSFRRHFRQLLDQAGLEVVGEADDIPSAEALLPLIQPDLAVVDVMLPGMSGFDGAVRLRELAPGIRVILVSVFRDQAKMFEASAREAGAEAFYSKDDLDLKLVQSWSFSPSRTQPARHEE